MAMLTVIIEKKLGQNNIAINPRKPYAEI